MSERADLSSSVTLARAIELATARVSAFERAREALGASPAEVLLLDAQRVWEQALEALTAVQADPRHRQFEALGVVGRVRVLMRDVAQDAKAGGHSGRELGGWEVFALLATEWGDLANELAQDAQRSGVRR